MEQTNFNETVAKLAEKAIQPRSIEAYLPDNTRANLLALPIDLKIQDLNHLMNNPLRIKESRSLNKPDGFCEYLNDFKNASTRIFGNPYETCVFNAVIDHHNIDLPEWGEHQAKLELKSTVPWSVWVNNEKNKMNHRQFINFIEDNIVDVVKPDHAALLESVREFNSDERFTKKSEVKGHGQKIDVSGELVISDIPEIITLGLSPYRYVKHYETEIRVSVHTGEDGVKFSYAMTNKDRILERVYDDLVDFVTEKTNLTIYT